MKIIKKILSWIKFEYNSIWNTCHFKRMVFKAKFKKMLSDNPYEVFFVIPFTKTSLGVINQMQRKDYNRFCLKNGLNKLTHNQLIKRSYYCTGQIINLK